MTIDIRARLAAAAHRNRGMRGLRRAERGTDLQHLARAKQEREQRDKEAEDNEEIGEET